MPLTPGARVGPYEILSPLGAGGMGEVYRARDTKLNRDVALKILPELFASDPDRLARFEREAQLLASLNHPHIAAIHGFEETATVKALVLELVEGPTLADRIAQGVLPLDEALAIARQIAEALEAAHERGVVHRDLKPANVKLTHDGSVKVLDFGLAKILDDGRGASAEGQRPAMSMSPTLSVHATYAGVILGTAAYMSPEQARGRAVDKRADVWAFGCVLFEMIAGARPFEGEDIAETIGAVIHKEPAWDRLPSSTPANVTLALKRCLQKDPRQRIRDIGDVQLALAGAFASAAPATQPAVTARRRSPIVMAAAIAIAAVAAAAATWALTRSTPAKLQPARFSIVPPATEPFGVQGFYRNLAIADDDTHIVYVAGSDSHLVVRSIDQLDAVSLTGITGAAFPFLSPDGRWIGFFTGAGGELKKISITGGPAVSLCRYSGTPRGATWSRDDRIVFATNDGSTGLLTVQASGGEPKILTRPDVARGEQDHLFPATLPDSRHVLFTISSASGIDAAQIAVLDLQTNQTKTLVRGGSDGQYVETGHIVYATAGSLRAVPFDPTRIEVKGDSAPIVEQVTTVGTGAADFRVSRRGTLVYVPGGSPGAGFGRSLAWVTRDGHEEVLAAPARSYALLRLSPDETQVAMDIRDQQSDIWLWNFRQQKLSPLTFDPAADLNPVWTPDGKRIVFGSARAGVQVNLFWQPSDGTGTAERLYESSNAQTPASFTPDGKSLVVNELGGRTGSDLLLFHLDTRRMEPLIQTNFTETGGEISPDGRWIAYYGNETGVTQVHVRPFPNVNAGHWLVSSIPGVRPVWSRNGEEIFFMAVPSGAVMAVPVRTTPTTFSAGNAVKLFDGPWFIGQTGRSYDVTADGKRFLMIKTTNNANPGAAPTSIVVVLNWTEELKARLPPK